MRVAPTITPATEAEDGGIAIGDFPPYARAGAVCRFVGQVVGTSGEQLELACAASGCTVFARLDRKSDVQMLGSARHLFTQHVELATSLLGEGLSVGLVLVAVAWASDWEQRGAATLELPVLRAQLERYARVALCYATHPSEVLLTSLGCNKSRSTNCSVSTA